MIKCCGIEAVTRQANGNEYLFCTKCRKEVEKADTSGSALRSLDGIDFFALQAELNKMHAKIKLGYENEQKPFD